VTDLRTRRDRNKELSLAEMNLLECLGFGSWTLYYKTLKIWRPLGPHVEALRRACQALHTESPQPLTEEFDALWPLLRVQEGSLWPCPQPLRDFEASQWEEGSWVMVDCVVIETCKSQGVLGEFNKLEGIRWFSP